MTVNDDTTYDAETEDPLNPPQSAASDNLQIFQDDDLAETLEDDLAVKLAQLDAPDDVSPSRWATRAKDIRFWFQIAALLFLGCFLIGWPLGTSWAEFEQSGMFRFRLGFTLPVFLYMITIPILIFTIGYMLALGCRMAAKAEELELSASKLMHPEVAAAAGMETVGSTVRSHINTLNVHLDEALNKLASVESMIRQQIKAIDTAAIAMEDKSGESVQRVAEERQHLIEITESLNREADGFAEAIAEKAKLGLEKSDAANARIAGAEKELENRLARLEGTSQKALVAFETLAEAIAKKEAIVSESSARLDLIKTEAHRKTSDLSHLMEENANAITGAQKRLEEESARLETLIKDQRERADRLAGAIAKQADRLGKITIQAEPLLSQAADSHPGVKRKPLSFSSIETETSGAGDADTPVLSSTTPLQHLKIEEAPTQQETVRQTRFAKSWSDILASADQPDEPLTLGDESSPTVPPEPSARDENGQQGNTNVIHLVRQMQQFMLDVEKHLYGPPQPALTSRFEEGERNIFANIILRRDEQDVKNRIRLETARNDQFRKSVYAFLTNFDQLLEPATGEQESDTLIDDYLGSPIGQVYLIIGSAMDYFS